MQTVTVMFCIIYVNLYAHCVSSVTGELGHVVFVLIFVICACFQLGLLCYGQLYIYRG